LIIKKSQRQIKPKQAWVRLVLIFRFGPYYVVLFFSPLFGRGLKGGGNGHVRGRHDEGHEHWRRTCEGRGGDFLIFVEGKSGDRKIEKRLLVMEFWS